MKITFNIKKMMINNLSILNFYHIIKLKLTYLIINIQNKQ